VAELRELPARTIATLLAFQAEREAARAFVQTGETTISYAEMAERSACLAAGLRALGVKRGDCICIMLQNDLAFYLAWFAIHHLGAIAVPLNTAYRGDLLQYVLHDSQARVVVADEDLVERLAAVRAAAPRLEHVVVVPASSGAGPRKDRGFHEVSLAALEDHPAIPPVIASEAEPAVIMYTSGTTGPSKGALLCHRGVLAFAANHALHCGIERSTVCHTVLPLFHGIGLLLTSHGALVRAARIVLGRRFSASRFWDEVRRGHASYTSMTGSMAQILMKQAPGPDDREHQVRTIYAVPAPAAIYRAFEERFGITFVEAYGATDGQVCVYTPAGAPRPGSCGRTIEGFELQIVNELDESVPAGTVGEIVYRSRVPYAMMLGYHNNPAATVEANRNFWFHSGDRGYLDQDGYLFFSDRKKDSIRRRGENVSSYEVEKVVGDHPAVLEAAAVAVPSELGEDDIKIVVVLKPGSVLAPVELIAWAEQRLAYFMVPRYVEFVAELPMTPNGKVQKYKLRETGTRDAWDRERAGYVVKR
jgi:crotonobetaine/carnitine-CoA ligase